MADDIKFHFQRLDTLQRERANFDSQWEEAAARLIPAHRSSFTGRGLDNVYGGQGAKKTEEMVDATASIANQRFGAVMESLGTPQSSFWHRLAPASKQLKNNRAVRLYFDELTELLFSYRYRPSANFVPQSQQVYTALGAYGNGTLYVDEPDDTLGLRYRYLHLGETFFAQNHAGIIDTLYRPFWLDARQAMQQFKTGLPEAITTAAQNANDSQKFEFLQCIYPNSDFHQGQLGTEGMRFHSKYITRVAEKVILQEGYYSFPAPTARYTQAPNEVYGRGPAQWVLPSIKLLNEEKKVTIKTGHRALDPVLLAHDDGAIDGFSLRNGALNKGGVNADGKPLVHALVTGNFAISEKLMEMEKQIIFDAFLINLFQILIDTPQMTATEVLERAREKGMLIAPTAGRFQAEFLGRLIERELDVLGRQGLLPPPPQILIEAGGGYKIEYDSPMSRMMRAEKAAGYLRSRGIAVEMAAATGDASILDHFNDDVAMPEIMDIYGSPTRWTRSEEQVAQRRASREEAAADQQMIEAAPSIAAVAKAAPAK